jgi:hypothetical protein
MIVSEYDDEDVYKLLDSNMDRLLRYANVGIHV